MKSANERLRCQSTFASSKGGSIRPPAGNEQGAPGAPDGANLLLQTTRLDVQSAAEARAEASDRTGAAGNGRRRPQMKNISVPISVPTTERHVSCERRTRRRTNQADKDKRAQAGLGLVGTAEGCP
jgi:hypothetical protein